MAARFPEYGWYSAQSYCPWNAPKFSEITSERNHRPDGREAADRPEDPSDLPSTDSPSLIELIWMTPDEWARWTRGSAIWRAGYTGFKRYVAVAMGNWHSEGAMPVLIQALREDEPLVRGHAAWALGRIGSREAREALTDALEYERDDQVRQEIESALG